MDYNYKEIRDEIRKKVKEACYSPKNEFSDTVWNYHILPVVKHSLALGKIIKADLEVQELAALLYDYAVLIDFKLYEDHHINGADIAEKLLARYNLPDSKKNIKDSIISHRGSIKLNKRR